MCELKKIFLFLFLLVVIIFENMGIDIWGKCWGISMLFKWNV